VEAQILADGRGNVIVVGTRDCSLQRRNQKLVEEAPAPFLTPAQREQIHASAKAICREAGYSGAGTVEYLLAVDGTVSFLEVNTRLQVEHGVTELVAGHRHRPGAVLAGGRTAALGGGGGCRGVGGRAGRARHRGAGWRPRIPLATSRRAPARSGIG